MYVYVCIRIYVSKYSDRLEKQRTDYTINLPGARMLTTKMLLNMITVKILKSVTFGRCLIRIHSQPMTSFINAKSRQAEASASGSK